MGHIKHIVMQSGELYTDVWLNGKYSRLQGIYPEVLAYSLVRKSRTQYTFKDN